MVVSGRIHAAVGAMSQYVPTVIIDYGHEPKAHKLKGFADVASQLKYLAQPDVANDLLQKMSEVWEKRDQVKEILSVQIPKVKILAKQNFEVIKNLF
jgi:colanic acid/amylovoran biosynthesis protein